MAKLYWAGGNYFLGKIGLSVAEVSEDDILVLDLDTGIVYQGNAEEASGDMESDVRDFLAST